MTNQPALRLDFSEADDLAAQLRGIAADMVPRRPGPFSGSLSSVQLGDVAIQVVRSAPVLLLGTAAPGMTGLIQLLDGSADARWNGQRIGPEEVALCAGRSGHEAVYQEAFACTVIGIESAGRSGDWAMDGYLAPPPDRRFAALCPNPDAQAGLAAIGRAIEAATVAGGAALREAEARRGLRAAILDTARGLMVSPYTASKPQRHAGRARQRIVHAADDYLRAHPERPIYTDELCAALGVSATSLYQAFRSTFGMSPHRYLKMRRMGMVRAALRARSGPWHSVKAIALSHGFWHLGQFARDYHALYGEPPSATLFQARIAGDALGDPGAAGDASAFPIA